VKKLLVLLGVGGLFIACLTGCPSPTSNPTTSTTTTTTTAKETKTTTKEGTTTTTTTTKTVEAKTHEGKFVSYKEDKLIIKGKDDKDHEFKVGKDAKVMSDGKEVKWDEIKKDADVTVTEKDGTATKVEVKKEKEAAPAEAKTHEGKFVSYKEDKLTIKGKDDKDHDYKVGKDVKPMSGDKEVKWDEIKKDADVTVTEKDGTATKVEVKK